MKTVLIFLSSIFVTLVVGCKSSDSQTTATAESPYPKVNVAPWFEVDASWPKRPVDMSWSDMPGVAIDKTGNIWCYTRIQPAIQVYSPEGTLIKSWSTETNSIAHQIKIDKTGNVWLADIGLHLVRKFTPDSKELMHIGTQGEAGKDETHLNKPTDMAIASNGDVFISDGYGNARIVHCDKSGKFIKAWGTLGNTDGRFSIPHDIAIDSKDRIYVADRNNVRIQIYDTGGKLVDSWRNIVVPWGFCIMENDDIWVCGSSPMKWRFNPKYPVAPPRLPAEGSGVYEVPPKWSPPADVDHSQGRRWRGAAGRVELVALPRGR